MAAPPSPGGLHLEHDSDPLYLSVIDLGGRIVVSFFAVVLIAVAVDVGLGNRLVFRSWTSFAVQAAAAFLLASLVAYRTLAGWQRTGSRFVPANVPASAVVIGGALGLGTLAGGFFPDAVNYQRRAPEMFLRSLTALVPAAIAVYAVLRVAAASRPRLVAAPPPLQESRLTSEARDAALSALDLLDRGDEALTRFQHVVSGGAVTSADAERLWAAMDGPGFVAHLRRMPPEHAVREALLAASVAQTDAAYLMALARDAHVAMGHTVESARELVNEVATRRGRLGADAEALAGLARGEAKAHRDIAAGLLHASRFSAS